MISYTQFLLIIYLGEGGCLPQLLTLQHYDSFLKGYGKEIYELKDGKIMTRATPRYESESEK